EGMRGIALEPDRATVLDGDDPAARVGAVQCAGPEDPARAGHFDGAHAGSSRRHVDRVHPRATSSGHGPPESPSDAITPEGIGDRYTLASLSRRGLTQSIPAGPGS